MDQESALPSLDRRLPPEKWPLPVYPVVCYELCVTGSWSTGQRFPVAKLSAVAVAFDERTIRRLARWHQERADAAKANGELLTMRAFDHEMRGVAILRHGGGLRADPGIRADMYEGLVEAQLRNLTPGIWVPYTGAGTLDRQKAISAHLRA